MNKWMLLMPLALIACGDKTDDTSTEGGEETASVQPQEGAWTMTSIEFTTDTCGMDEGDTGATDDTAALNLTKNEDGSYTMVVDEELTLSCALSGADFTCDPVTMSEEDADAGMTFIQTINLSGVFESNTAFNGDIGMEMSCEGENCAMLEQFGMTMPCSMEGTFAATAG
jgi:hypothetical protein